MPILLLVESGPHAGMRITVPDGGTVSIGRSNKANVALPQDTFLSGAHFAVESTPQGPIVRDLGSVNGTYVNSIRVAVARLQPGVRIGAGQTLFAVHFVQEAQAEQEAATPQPGELDAQQRRLVEILHAQREPLYVILDAARDPLILGIVRAFAEECQSLYEGQPAQDLVDFAPYICRVHPQSKLLEQIVLNWGKSWGVLLTAMLAITDVRQHVRQFLLVENEGGEKLAFRFYDPRVLRVFLPACNSDEVRQFFGPVYAFLCEDEDPELLLRFVPGPKGVVKEELDLAPEPAPVAGR